MRVIVISSVPDKRLPKLGKVIGFVFRNFVDADELDVYKEGIALGNALKIKGDEPPLQQKQIVADVLEKFKAGTNEMNAIRRQGIYDVLGDAFNFVSWVDAKRTNDSQYIWFNTEIKIFEAADLTTYEEFLEKNFPEEAAQQV
jgi:hypothetical protein